MDFHDTWIQWSSGVEGNRGVQEIWVKGHIRLIWGTCSNMLNLLRVNTFGRF